MKISDIRDLSKDDVLAAFGLETRGTMTGRLFGTLGIFSAGLLVGAGVALLLAPKTGQDLRQDLGQRLRTMRETGAELGADAADISDDETLSSNSSPRHEVRT
ncbi:MAG: YtxH domain-containing protein [Pseudomonadota bacterium]